MKKPNLFIIGAPKCGTTAMANWLSSHPSIFFSKSKEPHYYNKDHNNNVVLTYNHYVSLFKDATDHHSFIGEASVWYLYSKIAVDNILHDSVDENIKFIVMLRDPVKMAHSLHEQQVFNLNEPEKDFYKAWHLQKDREKNEKIGLTTRDAKLLLYGDACKLGEQVQRLLNKVDKVNIKFILLDEIIEDPLAIYKEVLSFLNLTYDGRTEFTSINTGKVRKSNLLAYLIKILGKFKQILKITKGFGILINIDKKNLKDYKREKLDIHFINELKDYFKEDILLLEKLINKDLSKWIN